MRHKLGSILLLLAGVILSSCVTHTVYETKQSNVPSSNEPTRILFVGNSYMYYNNSLHNHVWRITSELHPDIRNKLEYKSATIAGALLKHHNLYWLLAHKSIGVNKPFEVVIIQGSSKEAVLPDARADYIKKVRSYSKLIRKSGARPLLYMTPAYVAPHHLARPGLINVISKTTYAAARNSGIDVIPVGLAFDEAYRRRPEMQIA